MHDMFTLWAGRRKRAQKDSTIAERLGMTEAKEAGCYWWAEAPPQTIADARWSDQTDIAIIGCGFAGLSAAITLARAGRQVTIFEKEAIGFGASTRNGGITRAIFAIAAHS